LILDINKIYHSEAIVFMKQLPDNYVDLTISSPPYGTIRSYKGYTFDFEGIARQLFRITKQGGVVVWVCADQTINGSESGDSFRQALYFKDVCGFNLHDTMIYQKFGCPFPETTRYYPQFEYMFVLSKNKPKSINLLKDRVNKQAGEKFDKSTDRMPDGTTKPMSFNNTGRIPIVKEYGVRWNIWQYQGQTVAGHPAPFPEQLAADHIVSWSNKGDLLFDPMMGSGTVAKMAIILNRNFIGCDISEEYVALAKERIKPYQQQLRFSV